MNKKGISHKLAILAMGTIGFVPLAQSQSEQDIRTEVGAAAASTASGIYAIKKFSEIEEIEKRRTVALYDFRGEPKLMDKALTGKMAGDVRKGDKITIKYELSESESREFHVRKLQKEIEELKTKGRTHLAEAGRPGLGHHTGDTNMRVHTYADMVGHRHEADKLFEKAHEKEKSLMAIKSGEPIVLVEITEEIDTSKKSLNEWLLEKSSKGSKLVWMKKLPGSAVKQIARLKNLGRGGVVGVVAGAAVAGAAIVSDANSGDSESNTEDESQTQRTNSPTQYRRVEK